MSDRAPRARKRDSHKGEKTHRAEARRFLGTHMQQAMIRGLGDDVERCQAWAGVAYEMYDNDELGQGIYLNIVEKLKEAKHE